MSDLRSSEPNPFEMIYLDLVMPLADNVSRFVRSFA